LEAVGTSRKRLSQTRETPAQGTNLKNGNRNNPGMDKMPKNVFDNMNKKSYSGRESA